LGQEGEKYVTRREKREKRYKKEQNGIGVSRTFLRIYGCPSRLGPISDRN
jgi:hypothetical protein